MISLICRDQREIHRNRTMILLLLIVVGIRFFRIRKKVLILVWGFLLIGGFFVEGAVCAVFCQFTAVYRVYQGGQFCS